MPKLWTHVALRQQNRSRISKTGLRMQHERPREWLHWHQLFTFNKTTTKQSNRWCKQSCIFTFRAVHISGSKSVYLRSLNNEKCWKNADYMHKTTNLASLRVRPGNTTACKVSPIFSCSIFYTYMHKWVQYLAFLSIKVRYMLKIGWKYRKNWESGNPAGTTWQPC